MKISNVIFAFLLTICFASCDTKEALNLNDKLVGIQSEVVTFAEKHNADSNATVANYEKIKTFAKQKIDEAKALKGPKDGDAFKQAMVDDLEGLIASYTILIEMTNLKEGEDEKLLTLQNDLDKVNKNIVDLDNKVNVEQRKYANAHNFRLEAK
jgi:hypothetical protein